MSSLIKFNCQLNLTNAAKQLMEHGYQILLTVAPGKKGLTKRLQATIGGGALDAAGLFSIGEMITLISHASRLR